MTTLTSTPSQTPSRVLQGILCVELGMVFFVAQDAMMKSLLLTYPVWLLIFIRSIVSVLVLAPLIAMLGAPHRLRTPLWPLHLLRAFLFSIGFSLFYAAFPFMGLAEVTTIFFSAPLMTAFAAATLLREHIGIHRIGALVTGFVGVVIAINPTGEAFSWVAILPLICAATYALSQVLARQIGERESSLTVGLYTLGFSGIMILPMGWLLNQMLDLGPEFHHLHFVFPADLQADWPRLALLGAIGMAGYTLLGRAYQVASASLVAPFDYTYLPFAALLGYVLWDEVPASETLTGMALIIASGLYIGYRELRAARYGDDHPVLAEATYAPGNPVAQIADQDDLT